MRTLKLLVCDSAPADSEAFAMCDLHTDSLGTDLAVGNPRNIVEIARRVPLDVEIILIRKLAILEEIANVIATGKAA